jgi:hypothetical protein
VRQVDCTRLASHPQIELPSDWSGQAAAQVVLLGASFWAPGQPKAASQIKLKLVDTKETPPELVRVSGTLKAEEAKASEPKLASALKKVEVPVSPLVSPT